jgi:hypothetical protein
MNERKNEETTIDDDDDDDVLFSGYDPDVCRIWIENLVTGQINDCRLVIEDIYPEMPTTKKGTMLHSDFSLFRTERRYFSFLRLVPFGSGIVIDRYTGAAPSFGDIEKERSQVLEVGKSFSVTIAAHGNEANSRRMTLYINVVNDTTVIVTNETQ